jgi:hypothetical protein
MKIFYVSIFLFFSCSLKGSRINEESIKKEVQINKEVNFAEFYSSFRDAVLLKKNELILNSVNFPIEVRGYLDDDPILKINKKDFLSIFDASINTLTEVDPQTDEMCSTFYILKKTENILTYKLYTKSNEFQRFGNLIFNIINNEWKLTAIYTDTRNLKIEE